MQGLATFRLSTSPLHSHCYWSQQDELHTRISGQRARPACTGVDCANTCAANPPTGPAARPACAPVLQVFRCVGAWMCQYTPGKRVSLVRTAAVPPFLLPCPPPRHPSQFRTVGKKFAFQLSNRPPCVMSGLIHTGLGSSYIIAHVLHSPPPPPANSFVIGPAVINTHTTIHLFAGKQTCTYSRTLPLNVP